MIIKELFNYFKSCWGTTFAILHHFISLKNPNDR
nr:MAG TPA: hypothetical protein [Caudoviricetes sp.]